ncbi:hypothetical protein BDV35DRAFT_382246 [Aspergillus flavus]|uniref:DUF4246 domain-containing protein n=1 Tax=Aspergillus flavus TaxID=5059 RepID=A0A5N6GTI0_ASPFL|nr:hypothetical protein BDV35DRAFT_382246 [Aspergillus flavus]
MTVLGKLSHRRSRFGRRACLRDTLRKIESNTRKLSMENTSSQSRFPRWDGLNLEDYADTPNPWSEVEEDAYYEPLEAWDASRPIILPEPGVDLRKEFPGQRIQVIVKLANIELTPESPDYEGGSCHIEGQLHRVSSFSLADRSKPGHRRILALFLVDPHRRIISSANVPPQREDWLPEELESKAKRDMKPLMTMDEAREARLELMAERSLQSAEGNRKYETGDFNLCEH